MKAYIQSALSINQLHIPGFQQLWIQDIEADRLHCTKSFYLRMLSIGVAPERYLEITIYETFWCG